MSKQSQAQYLEESFRGIRDEYRLHANTALRIGTALLDLLRFAQLGEFDEITFNKVLNHPTFLKGLTTLGSIIFGEYAEGLKGGIITKEGVAELKDLWVREHAKLGDSTTHYDVAGRVLPALEVLGDSTFSGNLSSPEFISNFLGGLGWSIQKKDFVNAAGVTEQKYTLEIDNVVIRNTLRVFEMIVSQLLGENANRVFSDMMVVDHYDKRTGKVMLKTQDGQLYNSLRSGDYIEVQQFNGDPNIENDWYVTKAYEFRVKEVGIGSLSDGKDRLDWLTFENFSSQMEDMTPEKAFKEGDTLVRVDSERSDRKGVITIMAVGENTPYMDVLYGMKTDPEHALKGRLGNLNGIRSDVFGWLEGYGAYLNNLYAVGKFFDYQTGENLKARVEMSLARFRSFYSETTFNVSDSDNFLKNGFFQQALDSWTPCDLNGNDVNVNQPVEAVGNGGQPLLFNGVAINTSRRSLAEIKEVDGIQVLYLRNMGVAQDFNDIKPNGFHEEFDPSDELGLRSTQVADQLFMGIRIMPITGGRLNVRFKRNGRVPSGWTRDIDPSLDWQLSQASDSVADPWEYSGTGKLFINYTGECYIRFVALQSDPIVNSKLTYSTLIEQNSRRITLEASRQDENLINAVAQINIEFDKITTIVTDNKDAADIAFESLVGKLDDEVAARIGLGEDLEELEGIYKATWVYQNDHLLALMAAEFDSNGKILGYAALQVKADTISAEVGKINGNLFETKEQVSSLRVAAEKISARVSTVETKATTNASNIETVTTRVGELSVESGKISARVSTVEEKYETNTSNIENLWEQVSELEMTDSDITLRVSTVEKKSKTNETNIDELDNRLGNDEYDIETVTTRVGELRVESERITARVSTVEEKSSKNDSNIKSVTKRVGSLEVKDNEIIGRVETVETKSSTNENDIVTIKNNVSELKATDENINATVKSVKQTANSNKSRLDGHDSKLEDYLGRISTLELNEEGISGRVSAVEGRVSQIDDVNGWEKGSTHNESAGKTYDQIKYKSSYHIRTKELYPVNSISACFLSDYGAENMKVAVVYFNSSKTICSTTKGGWLTGSKIDLDTPSDCAYVAVILALQSDEKIAVSDVLKSGIAITSDRVVSEAEISLMVKKTDDGYISNAKISADKINFTFTKSASFYAKKGSTVTEVMNINPAGDLWIKGDLKGGKVKGDYTVGDDNTLQVEIYVDERINNQIPLLHSGIRGKYNTRTYMDFSLTGVAGSGSDAYYVYPYLSMNDGKDYAGYHMNLTPASIKFSNNGYALQVGMDNSKILITGSSWPKQGVDNINSLPSGTVYLRSDNCLCVK